MAALNITNALFMVASAGGTIALYKVGLSIPEIFALLGISNVLAMLLASAYLPEFAHRLRAILTRTRT